MLSTERIVVARTFVPVRVADPTLPSWRSSSVPCRALLDQSPASLAPRPASFLFGFNDDEQAAPPRFSPQPPRIHLMVKARRRPSPSERWPACRRR